MSKYVELPNTILSPLTGAVLTLQPKGIEAAADFFEDCTEYIEPVAVYTDKKETIYIPYNDE
jgi:hypothetical protein